ncbi:MAG TPA: SIS domain-containing protein [Candidatus Hydrogenedentes bacterium]|nr:SIS domain-containing protein [Candidatus Hydrogenedentota bacterium]HOJ67249.1 SIS domain-containing protein [Candidatus Hydrogenedentota bacterium]HOK88418.1 SIS domain-containing protein [Candidatus Hydrogenedentota bacterium]
MSTDYDLPEPEIHLIQAMLVRRPDLHACVDELIAAHKALVTCFSRGGTLFTCGNGGSWADALHIVGELCKSFERRRPLDEDYAAALRLLPFGEDLADNLESGLRAITLGLNGALKTAVENDCPLRDIAFAQELNVMMRPGDVLLALSTSGKAVNCRMAMSVARAKGGVTIAMTGPQGGPMGEFADIVIRAPGDSTKVIQEAHATLWHTLCCLVEIRFFPEKRA